MARYVLDSWAWIEYLEGSTKGDRVREIILDSRNEIFTHSVTVAEIMSKASRNRMDVDAIWATVSSNSKIVETKNEESKEAGITHAETKTKKNRNFSLADAFVLATARRLKAKVVTGDMDFKNIDDVILL
jgi:predicted nucleic acid-binding protein